VKVWVWELVRSNAVFVSEAAEVKAPELNFKASVVLMVSKPKNKSEEEMLVVAETTALVKWLVLVVESVELMVSELGTSGAE